MLTRFIAGLTLAFVFFLAAPAAAEDAGAADAGFWTIEHWSPTLQQEKTFQAWFPPDIEPGERLPVLFMLHGAYGSYKDWPSKSNVLEIADRYRMILVFPDGSPFGWYVDSPIEETSQYESYIAKELVPLVDQRFPTLGTRDGRGIMGLSMGGHGAFLLAAKHPDLFGSASSMSGILHLTNHPGKWTTFERLGPMEENREAWVANSVYDQAERFIDADVRLLFDCGEEDTQTGAIGDNRELHARLLELGVPHIWREMPGTHSWDYWKGHLEEHLNFHQAAMLGEKPEEGEWYLGRWRGHYFARLDRFLRENAELEIADPSTSTSVVLLGSSSMEGFDRTLLEREGLIVHNRGISADVLGIYSRGISHRMESGVFDIQPDFVFIKNGRNDLGNRHRGGKPSIDAMIEEYDKIVRAIKDRAPESVVVVTTVAPVRGRYEHLREPIVAYNNRLRILAKDLDVELLDLHPQLVGEDGLMPEEFTNDGLHLTHPAQEIWAEMMLEVVHAHAPAESELEIEALEPAEAAAAAP